MKGSQRLPGASIKTETSLQPRYGRLDPCAEPAQTIVNVLTAAHAIYTDAALLCKTDVLDVFRLRPFKFLFMLMHLTPNKICDIFLGGWIDAQEIQRA